MSTEILTAIILIASNALTAWITNFASRKKEKAEESKLISEAYTTLVEDLQIQIEKMKHEIEELKGQIIAMVVREKDMSLKIRNLEHENKSLKNSN